MEQKFLKVLQDETHVPGKEHDLGRTFKKEECEKEIPPQTPSINFVGSLIFWLSFENSICSRDDVKN